MEEKRTVSKPADIDPHIADDVQVAVTPDNRIVLHFLREGAVIVKVEVPIPVLDSMRHLTSPDMREKMFDAMRGAGQARH